MNRNNRSSNNRRDRQQPKNVSSTVASGQALPQNLSYDEAFPALSGPPITTATNNQSSSTQISTNSQLPASDKNERQRSATTTSENSKSAALEKKAGPWKQLPEPSEIVSLPVFIPPPTTKKVFTTTTEYQTNYRSSTPANRPMTALEDSIDTKLCEIILSIHLKQQFVSLERVKQELFQQCGVQSFRDLRVNERNLKALNNHIQRIKNVTFYMQIFEQVFNLCTLQDLSPLLAKFLNVDKYEDAHLGPLDENPEVRRVFKYKPEQRHQPIPNITSGDIIQTFLSFQEKYHRKRFDYEEFLDELVEQNQLQKREELGLYCKSFPYLSEVSRKVMQESKKFEKRVDSDARKKIIDAVETQLWEIQREVVDELDLSSYINKTPIAVFDHLVAVVEKHLTVPQQKAIRDILMKVRNDELLRCLLNVSIYLGTIDQPEKFIAELQKLNQKQTTESGKQNLASTSLTTVSKEALNRSNRNRDHQHLTTMQNSGTSNTDLNRPTIETAFESSFSHQPQTSIKQLSADIFKILTRFDTMLTLKQLFDVEKRLCHQYSVESFSELSITSDNDDATLLDMVSFLNIHREKIDPKGELSIYDSVSSLGGDRQEIYSFVNQLTMLNTWREKQQEDQGSTTREIPLSKDQLSAVEKAVQHKFGGSLSNTRGSQIIKKAKTQLTKTSSSIIHFEESLLDEVSLNRLGNCPPSLLIDESQLCELILQCPIMNDLPTWLQWSHFFQSRYGSLKTFIARKEQELEQLLLIETSNHELLRLPKDSSLGNFQDELYKGNIRASVGHLCALIVNDYVQVNQLPLTIYRQVINTWFVRLRSAAALQRDKVEPMQYVLEFLTYLPALIGRSRIIQELILEPLDEVFGDGEENESTSARQRIWTLARGKEKAKLEVWGYTLDIDEWKNENKWRRIREEEQQQKQVEKPHPQQLYNNIQMNKTLTQDIVIPEKVQDVPFAPDVPKPNIPILLNPNIDENNSTNAAKEHIKKIREGFGADSSLDAASQSIVTNLQGVLARSLAKLSNDLYSEQGHFVLELVQNADDNHYPSDCLPTLRFIVSSERVLVCNNEVGFQPSNVAAICNVGKSTKGKHKPGYTGHKGIGFKSVFMVSHRPEIHSGDYHFCFDTNNGLEEIGYIRPIWLETSNEVLPSTEQWTTCIRLPIRTDKRGDRLKRNFDDIHARLLLFLNRLRQIEIVREKTNDEKDIRIFTRYDHADGQIIELQKTTTTSENISRSFWLVVKAAVSVPPNIKSQLNDVRCEVESTTIAIAYPLDAVHDASSYAVLPSQPLFAYLPLRSYGFRFILQGDFEIPATRQEVLRDNVWNEWLKQEMIQLLPKAYDLFKTLPNLLTTCSSDVQKHIGSLNIIETLKYFLKMIPTRNEIDPYFNSFIDKTVKGLMGSIQLPIINEENNEITHWVSPLQCVFVRDSFIRQIFTQNLLSSHFNKYYLNEQFVNECDENILIKLGCQRLDFSTILKLIKTLYTQNEQAHSTKTTTIEQIAQWFLCIDYSLQQERDKPGFSVDNNEQHDLTTIDQLKQMKIIPLKQQTRLVSIEEMKERAILFPLDKSTPFAKYLKIVLEDLPTIDERLIDFIEKKYPRRLESIKSLLTDLGISESRNVRRIYSHHILPTLSDEAQWSSKSDSVLIAYVIFVYKSLYSPKPEHFTNEMEVLKNKLVIKTHQGKFVRLNSNGSDIIHLPTSYGCQKSLDGLKLFANRFQFISDDYLKEYHTEMFFNDRERRQFVYFLNELDLHDFFLIKKVDHGFINIEQLAQTQWSHSIGGLSTKIFEPFMIRDFRCDEVEALLTSKDAISGEQYLELLLYLNYMYQSLARYYVATVIRSRERARSDAEPLAGVESSLCLSLRKHPWIPVTGGDLFKPTDVYYLPMNSPFRRYVPCLDSSRVQLTNKHFVDLLGFKLEISPKTMFELLIKWSCNLDSDSLWKLTESEQSNIIPCTISPNSRQLCHDTLSNIQNIYIFIASDREMCLLLARFRLWPLIFVPRTIDIGEFLFANEVFWHDPATLLTTIDASKDQSTQQIALQQYYANNSSFQRFFFETLRVKQQPTFEDYLQLLSNVKDKKNEYVWKCIDVITGLAYAQNKQTILKDTCVDWPFIPCLGNPARFAKYTDRLYYPHDKTVADLFADVISIIKLPDSLVQSSEFKQRFCSLFKIEDLADVIKMLVEVDNEEPAMELLDFYSNSIDLIQQVLIMNGVLSETRSAHLQSVFSDMSIVAVERIHLSYQYGENVIRKALSSSSVPDSYIDESTRKFFIVQKDGKHDGRHINTMVNYLVADASSRLKLLQFIQHLYKIYHTNGVEGLEKERHGLPELQLPKWIIPRIIKKELKSSPIVEEKEEADNDTVIVPVEMIRAMKAEPLQEVKKPANVAVDPDKPKPLSCFPSNAGATDLGEPTVAKQKEASAINKANSSSSTSVSPSSLNSLTNKSQELTDDGKKNIREGAPEETDKLSNSKPKQNSDTRPNERSAASNNIPLTVSDFMTAPPRINFEQIRIMNFADAALSSTLLPHPPISASPTESYNETDAETGRRGEELVYQYLLWKHPDAEIKWINQENEFGHPFDIQMIRKGTNSKELIEVKTTRVPQQNTFQISVKEVECLLSNQNNYYIYRVYYTNDVKSSTITILSEIKCHLQEKQLALSITIGEKANKQQ